MKGEAGAAAGTGQRVHSTLDHSTLDHCMPKNALHLLLLIPLGVHIDLLLKRGVALLRDSGCYA